VFSSDDYNVLVEQMMTLFGPSKGQSPQNISSSCCKDKKNINRGFKLSPQKVLVILGLIAGVLEVRSVLVDRDQAVQILLDGSLKRKTRLDKMLDEIGSMPFDEVLKAIMGRL
jgi:hypothetical protein